MVRIIRETPRQYIIEWSQPEGDPSTTALAKNKKVMTVEELALIVAWDSRLAGEDIDDSKLASSQ